ncbi:hypothetical protein [Lysobacter gummosus]|uniref:hypothetical protein n=1 Tax=Lysobacter gummosus TaxID=262324 RepID=UPI00363D5205
MTGSNHDHDRSRPVVADFARLRRARGQRRPCARAAAVGRGRKRRGPCEQR